MSADTHTDPYTGNLIVFSHYPTDYLMLSELHDLLRTEDPVITYFGAHRHATCGDWCSHPIYPTVQWTVGGGGGFSCDGDQGFVVGDVLGDGTVLNTRFVEVSREACCEKNEHGKGTPLWFQMKQQWWASHHEAEVEEMKTAGTWVDPIAAGVAAAEAQVEKEEAAAAGQAPRDESVEERETFCAANPWLPRCLPNFEENVYDDVV